MTHRSVDPRQQKILELMSGFMKSGGLEGFIIIGYRDGLDFKSVKVCDQKMFMDMAKALAFHLDDTLESVVSYPPPPSPSSPPPPHGLDGLSR